MAIDYEAITIGNPLTPKEIEGIADLVHIAFESFKNNHDNHTSEQWETFADLAGSCGEFVNAYAYYKSRQKTDKLP